MNKYIVTVAHDRGIIQLKVTAPDKAHAAALVMRAEGCPSCAILAAQKVK